MRYAQLVMGPAGSGKSTYCSSIVKHGEAVGRMIRVVNLDPAAENFDYPTTVDIRELVQLEDAMEDEEMNLGPNGALVFCMEYLADNLDWLEEQLGESEDDYYLFDCPGQIELYTHLPVMQKIVSSLASWNFAICGVFLLDTQFVVEASKFFSGALVALSTMVSLEIPSVNILSKMDLLSKRNRETIESFLDPTSAALTDRLRGERTPWNDKHSKLSATLAQVLEDYNLVKFLPLNLTDEDSITDVLVTIDNTIQYGEDMDVKDRYPEEMEREESGDNGFR